MNSFLKARECVACVLCDPPRRPTRTRRRGPERSTSRPVHLALEDVFGEATPSPTHVLHLKQVWSNQVCLFISMVIAFVFSFFSPFNNQAHDFLSNCPLVFTSVRLIICSPLFSSKCFEFYFYNSRMFRVRVCAPFCQSSRRDGRVRFIPNVSLCVNVCRTPKVSTVKQRRERSMSASGAALGTPTSLKNEVIPGTPTLPPLPPSPEVSGTRRDVSCDAEKSTTLGLSFGILKSL